MKSRLAIMKSGLAIMKSGATIMKAQAVKERGASPARQNLLNKAVPQIPQIFPYNNVHVRRRERIFFLYRKNV